MPTCKLPLLLAILALPGIASAQPATTTAPATTQGAVDAEKPLTLEGFIAPRDPYEAKVELKSFGGPLKVKQVVEHGSTVRQGASLIDFDTTEIDDQILSAASEVDVARANLAKAEADVSLGDRADAASLEERTDALADAQTELEYWKKQDGPNFLKRLELSEKMGQYQIDDQNDELDQLRKMYKSESLTNATADIVVKRAVRGLEMSIASNDLQKAEIEKQRKTDYVDRQQDVERGVESAQRALDEFNAQSAQSRVQRANALTQARIGLRAAQRKLSELEQDKAAMSIVAPGEGVAYFGSFGDDGGWQNASDDAIRAGQKKGGGETLLTFVEPGKVHVVAKASDDHLRQLKVDQAVHVTVKAIDPDQRLDGTIRSISPLPSGDGTFAVEIALKSDAAKLVPGMKASVEVAP